MTNRESLTRHVSSISEQLNTLEYYCDTEIVGDDARHLLADIKSGQKEIGRVINNLIYQNVNHVEDLKPLYDRLKKIHASVRVMRNSLSQCEKAIALALDSADHAAENLSQDTNEDL